MTTTTPTPPTVDQLMAELSDLADPKILAVNERHGDDHAVNLTSLRAVAKRIKKNQALARELWATRDSAARLLAILTCRPKEFSAAELDAMIRDARTRKVHDWLVNYVVMKGPHAEDLRLAWLADADPVVASSWACCVTTRRRRTAPRRSLRRGSRRWSGARRADAA